MADRALEITLRCATDLKKVNLISKMDVYVVVSISGSGDSKKIKTPADRGGGSSPTWNFPIRFAVEETPLLQNRLTLNFKLICNRALGDKVVGEVHVPIKELLDSPADGGRMFVSYQVTKPSGRPKGQLTFSYKFIGYNRQESESKKDCAKPVAMYPPLYPTIDGQFQPPYKYVYPSPEPNCWYPPPPRNVYPPPLPMARINNSNFESFSYLFMNLPERSE